MKYTGETAIALAEKYGLPIQKKADEDKGYRENIPLEDAQWILSHGDPDSIFVEAEPELAKTINENITGLAGE